MAMDANLNDPSLRRSAVDAACGRRPFDLLIENARILDMVTGLERAADIGLVGALVASVHAPDPSLEAAQRINADGAYAVPGFIDTHMHIESSMITPSAYSDIALSKGVTSVVWDPHELANVAGIDGVEHALAAARHSKLRILTLAPTCVPSAPGYEFSGGDFDQAVLADLLSNNMIHGSAELMTMHPLLSGDERVSGIVAAGLASGKRVCGHGRGLEGRDLAAYAAAGVETDHELTSADDLIARLEMGMTVELRGSHEHLLPEFAKALLQIGHMPQTVTLCTDDVFPDDLLHKGALDRTMRVLIKEGVPASWVYRAATLNAASRIGRSDLGIIAPGKRADFVLLSDLEDVRAASVFMDGEQVVENGICVAHSAPVAPAPALCETVKTAAFDASDFDIPATGSKARIATLSKPRFPQWGERIVDVEDGKVVLPEDMIRMAVVNRHGRFTPVRVALLENWGTWRGAFGTTVSHDSHNLTVFGRNTEDMVAVANALRLMGGGLAVAQNGQVTASLPLPIAGLISPASLEDVSQQFAKIREAMDALVDWEPPYLVFKALFGSSLVCNPGPRLSDAGIVEVFEGKIMESCVLETVPPHI